MPVENGVVVLDIDDFRKRYPGLALFDDDAIQQAFASAEAWVNNKPNSTIPLNIREYLIYTLMCHLLTLAKRNLDMGGAAGIVSSASEGTVSIGMGIPAITDRSFFLESPCGREFWYRWKALSLGGNYIGIKYNHPYG